MAHTIGLNPGSSVLQVMGDFAGSIIGAAFSMPLNQSYNYLVTASPEARSEGIVRSTVHFLKGQYLSKGVGGRATLSRTVARDLFMRCACITGSISATSTLKFDHGPLNFVQLLGAYLS